MLRGVSVSVVRLQCHCLERGTLAGQLLVRGKATQLASKKPNNLSVALALLSQLAAKDSQLAALQAAKNAELAAKDAQLAALQAAKDVQQAALQAAKDAQLAALQAAKDAVQSEFSALQTVSKVDAIELAALLHEKDVAAGKIGVRSTLEVVIAELWKENKGDGTKGATDRLQQLAKGEKSIPGLRAYVQECAKDNNIDPDKALEMLPKLYRELSGPMHASSLGTGGDRLIEAMLSDNPTAVLLVSCLFKLTRRDLRLYHRDSKGERIDVVLKIKEPRCPPALAKRV